MWTSLESSSLSYCTQYAILCICKECTSRKIGSERIIVKTFFGPCLTVNGFSELLKRRTNMIGMSAYLMVLNQPPLLSFVLEAEWICWGKDHALLLL